VTKTCLQCGAVLPSSVRNCNFCESSFSADFSSSEEFTVNRTEEKLAPKTAPDRSTSKREREQDTPWRGELAQRLAAYRTRRGKLASNIVQSRFAFTDTSPKTSASPSVEVGEPPAPKVEDFSFTIAIGRPSKKRIIEESRMVIDVSQPPDAGTLSTTKPESQEARSDDTLFPVASIDNRRLAAVVDLFCLLFAYGGFLLLFGSLGGEFTLSKLSAAVYTTTFAIVYLQYFALFTIFGGTTPGMMMRNLQVTSFSGEPPTPRQMLLRTAGYTLSAGAFFLGFLWAMWDEDELTWHDRLSHTYLSPAQTFADIESSSVAHS